jgi:hypothetical protein
MKNVFAFLKIALFKNPITTLIGIAIIALSALLWVKGYMPSTQCVALMLVGVGFFGTQDPQDPKEFSSLAAKVEGIATDLKKPQDPKVEDFATPLNKEEMAKMIEFIKEPMWAPRVLSYQGASEEQSESSQSKPSSTESHKPSLHK